MENLEQIRAKNALLRAESLNRRDARKLPALIINNGFLAAAAFTLDSKIREGLRDVVEAIAEHLNNRDLLTKSPAGRDGNERIRSVIGELSGKEPHELQRATDESLAYIAYLKRFAKKGDEDDLTI